MNKKQFIWVIDIGNYSTKIIRAKRDQLENIEICDVILETNWNKRKMGEEEDFLDRLTILFKAYQRKDKVILLIGDDDIRLDFWRFPAVDETEIESMVYWKMQELSTNQLKYFHYDYLAKEGVDNFKNLGIKEYYIDALSVLVAKELILNYTTWLKKNGKIRLNAVLPQFYGIGESLRKIGISRCFFLDLGFSKTIIYDFKHGMLADKIGLIPEEKQTLKDYLETIKGRLEDNIQLDQYKKEQEKPLLFLIGGGSLVSEIPKNLMVSHKWKLSSLDDLLEKWAGLGGVEQIKKEEMGLFFPALAALNHGE